MAKKLRILYYDRKRKSYIRFAPNPGFKFGRFHWCAHYGRGDH